MNKMEAYQIIGNIVVNSEAKVGSSKKILEALEALRPQEDKKEQDSAKKKRPAKSSL